MITRTTDDWVPDNIQIAEIQRLAILFAHANARIPVSYPAMMSFWIWLVPS